MASGQLAAAPRGRMRRGFGQQLEALRSSRALVRRVARDGHPETLYCYITHGRSTDTGHFLISYSDYFYFGNSVIPACWDVFEAEAETGGFARGERTAGGQALLLGFQNRFAFI